MSGESHDPVKDEDSSHPVPTAWRAAFEQIVSALVRGDYGLRHTPACVERLDDRTASQIRDYIRDCGQPLVELPDATWESSVCQWQSPHWDVLVDLWTTSGASDMVISARVFSDENGALRIVVDSVHVPSLPLSS